MAFKTAEGLGRFNAGAAPESVLAPSHGKSRILVADRSLDETFMGRRPGAPDAYRRMMSAARAAHPAARIIVKRDPGVAGALSDEDLRLADEVIEADVDIPALVAQVDQIYTVAGLIGLEAIWRGRPVACFGSPFYAGWGLTADELSLTGRTGRRTREELFAAAYLVAARYVDPLDASPCTARLAFERLAGFRRHARRVAGRWVGLNIPPVKHDVMRAFLAGPCSSFSAGGPAPAGARLAAWAARPNGAVRRALQQTPEQVVNIEDGFIRSVGLGSSFHPAASLVIDTRGIYYDPSAHSDLEIILGETAIDPALLARAAALRRRLVDLNLSKYNLEAPPLPAFEAPPGRPVILATGQVENDASVIAGAGGTSNLTFLERVRTANPDAFIIYKPHPDVVAGNRPGAVPPSRACAWADMVLTDGDTTACIEAVDEVHTLTSLTGFEALLREKTVAVYGWPFYAGWGLTRDLGPALRARPHVLSLDALVAGALILYPLYLDPVSWLPCDPETYLTRLQAVRSSPAARQGRRGGGGLGRYLLAARHIIAPRRTLPY